MHVNVMNATGTRMAGINNMNTRKQNQNNEEMIVAACMDYI